MGDIWDGTAITPDAGTTVISVQKKTVYIIHMLYFLSEMLKMHQLIPRKR